MTTSLECMLKPDHTWMSEAFRKKISRDCNYAGRVKYIDILNFYIYVYVYIYIFVHTYHYYIES